MKKTVNRKKILIGVDEAGYGPNLGPLVIGLTLWKSPAAYSESDICKEFARFSEPRAWVAGCDYVPLGDSKKIYQSDKGLASLETGLLAMLQAANGSSHRGDGHGTPRHLDDFVRQHAFVEHSQTSHVPPWYRSLQALAVPRDADGDEIARLGELASRGLTSAGIELVAVRGLVVSESSFNQGVLQLGSKGQLLSRQTLGLVADALTKEELDAEIYCDRQGGRRNYLPVLFDALPDEWFDETAAGTKRCSYRNRGQRSLEVHFSVQGDSFPPTALASMLAKYLREQFMLSLNAFWQGHLPNLKPTAGYPVDAQRFRREMQDSARRLGLLESSWWRCR